MNAALKSKRLATQFIFPCLDILGILAWGLLLLKYSFTGELRLLIHPNYFGLVSFTGVVLVVLSLVRAWQWSRRFARRQREAEIQDTVSHITLLPTGVGSILLLVTAILGFAIAPTVFSSNVALQRGVSNTLPATQLQTQSFQGNIKPEERSLMDWIRILNAYPEPDAYAGQKAKITGFVVHPENLPDNYILLTRFVLTCCAVDVYPVALPVRLEGSRAQYPQDTWLEVQGIMETDTLNANTQNFKGTESFKRQLVLVAESVKTIPTPADPYSY
ncbi:MAG: TIGR03943 family protein [Snowella sp.]|nr:TIGR03943 family protein [Snowella sp.]